MFINLKLINLNKIIMLRRISLKSYNINKAYYGKFFSTTYPGLHSDVTDKLVIRPESLTPMESVLKYIGG